MIVVCQRVREASVSVKGKIAGRIQRGVCLLLGFEKGDTGASADYLARKIVELRIFPDNEGKMNLSLCDVCGEVLAVSQFTLAGSVKKGRRPSFDKAEEPSRARELFGYFVDKIKKYGLKVQTGVFGASMDVSLINEGPVTFILQKKNTLS